MVALVSGVSGPCGSESVVGLSGVRKGDLNGFFKVLVASFSLRRLACGVNILTRAAALSVVKFSRTTEVCWSEYYLCAGDV